MAQCSVKLVLGSAAPGMVAPGIASPLLHSCRRRRVPVVLVVAYCPFSLVEPSLLPIDIHQVVYSLLPGHAVNCKEVLE